MSYIDIKNKKGTADQTPPSGYLSWLDFWEKKKGKKADRCEVINLISLATLLPRILWLAFH